MKRPQRSCVILTAAILAAAICAACDYRGEDTTREKELTPSSTVKTAVGGAGSTFMAPIMNAWINAYKQTHPGTSINYRAIGSGAGISELKQKTLEFAGSDAPLSDSEIQQMYPVVQVPVTAGAICAAYNVPGLTAPLRLSGATLAEIFLGEIISWQDPAIARENPGAKLPRAAIIVVHRTDASGSTSIFSSYLAKVSAEWSRRAGQGLTINWPVGIGAEGSKGVLDFVKQNPGTIGYGELGYAKERSLPAAQIQNRAGTFVEASPASTTAAVEAFLDALSKDDRAPIVDPPASAKDAYPLAGLTYVLVPKDGHDAEQRRALKDFLDYAATTGQDAANALSYAKLPKSLQQHAQSSLDGLTADGQPVK